uniref:Fungal lipase-type domain-containing protein n=1 Tax=Oryza punctata TaxID=4537 RepID=A0A0E0MPK4_ORYPU
MASVNQSSLLHGMAGKLNACSVAAKCSNRFVRLPAGSAHTRLRSLSQFATSKVYEHPSWPKPSRMRMISSMAGAVGDGEEADDRAELHRYGLMVDAAYLTYADVKKQPSGGEHYETVLSSELDRLITTAGEDASRRRHVVTAHHFATIEPLPAVLDALPVVGGVDKTYWFGYVAVVRRDDCWDVVVAWRGSATLADWMMDMHVMKHVDFGGLDSGAGQVAEGFYNVYTSMDKEKKHGKVSAKEQVVKEVKRLVDHLRRRNDDHSGEKPVKVQVTVTGHSLGGALAMMTAHDVAAALAATAAGVRVRAITFGAPRVGDDAFRRALVARGVQVFRVIVQQDIVPKLPMGDQYADAGDYDIINLDDGGRWLSPLELIQAHSLDLYLHLITLRNPAIASELCNSSSDAPPPPPANGEHGGPPANDEWVEMKEEEGYMRLPLKKLKEELDKLEGPSPRR